MSFGIATGAFEDERDDWPAAVARARAGDWPFLELTAIDEERLDRLVPFLDADPAALRPFERVSVHAPVGLRTSAAAVLAKLERLGAFDLVVHPDVYSGEGGLRRLGGRVVFENMDVQKSFGRFCSELARVFSACPEAGFCLDVAHAFTNDSSLRLADELLDVFGNRLRQVHVSGIEPDGRHRPTTAEDLDLYAPVLERCPHVPWILETEPAEGSLASFGS